MFDILLIKSLSSILFLALYIHQWLVIKSLEARLAFLFFFLLYYIGGVSSSIFLEDVKLYFPGSGLYQTSSTELSWILYFTLCFLVPYIFVWLIEWILKYRRNDDKTGFIPSIYLWFYFVLFILCLLYNVGYETLFYPKHTDYTQQIMQRYTINYSPVFVFFTLVGGFILFFNLSLTYLCRYKSFWCWFLLLFFLVTYYLVVDRVFYSKLYLVAYFISIMFTLFILYKGEVVKVFAFFIVSTLLFLVYYNHSVYGGFEYILLPIIKAVTRYSNPIYYYVDYYLNHDFEGGFYFSGTLTGETSNYLTKLYNHTYAVTDTDVVGTLSSGLIVHNFANIGVFAIMLSLIEFFILICLYALCRTNSNPVLNLSVFSFLIFSVMNLSFISVLINPSSGVLLLCCFLLLVRFAKIKNHKSESFY